MSFKDCKKCELTSEFTDNIYGQNDLKVKPDDVDFYEKEYRKLSAELDIYKNMQKLWLEEKLVLKNEIRKLKENKQTHPAFKNQQGKGRKKKNIDIKTVLELRANGYSIEKISKLFGVSSKTIHRRIKSVKAPI